jgi:hypothetical protein
VASPAVNTTNPALLVAKLGALVRDIGLEEVPTPSPGGGGAATQDEGIGYVLHAPEYGIRSLGPALLWTIKNNLGSLVLFSDDHADHLARRAGLITNIDVSVRQVTNATSQPTEPLALAPPPELPAEVLDVSSIFLEAGTVPVDDFGRLVAETVGLEVARAQLDQDGALEVAVGVGQADRELHELVHSNLTTVDAVTRAAAMVAEFRQPNAEPHPLNRLGRARWLRSLAVKDPALVGVGVLAPVPPLRFRDTVLGTEPTCATSESAVVVFSAGVDPDLVPEALEYRQRHNPDAELVIVMASNDTLPTVARLMETCANTRVVEVSPPWV